MPRGGGGREETTVYDTLLPFIFIYLDSLRSLFSDVSFHLVRGLVMLMLPNWVRHASSVQKCSLYENKTESDSVNKENKGFSSRKALMFEDTFRCP